MEKSPTEQKSSTMEETFPTKSKDDVEEKGSSESYSDRKRRHHKSHHRHEHRHSHRRHSKRRRSRSRSRSRSHAKKRSPDKIRKAKEVPFDAFPSPNRARRGIFESELPEVEETKNIPIPVAEQPNAIQILLTQSLTTVDSKQNDTTAPGNIKELIEFPRALGIERLNSEEEIDRRQSYFRMVEKEREQCEANQCSDNPLHVNNTSTFLNEA